jgi:hypothetical protein
VYTYANMRVDIRLRIGASALLLAGLASSQNARVPVQIDDTGTVIPAHQQRHVKNGQSVVFARTNASGSWFVRFVDSPCANGLKEFGSAKGNTCVITVCASKDSSCKSYHYSSALGPNQPPHDPDVIVDN